MAYLGKTPSQAVRSRYYFTASGGETSLAPAQVTGLSFTDANYVDVSLNGVALVSGTDYTATPSTNTISSLSALTASDVVEIVVYDTFSVFGGSVNGDFNISSGDLTLGDNDKAIFGAGSDLQIFHDGSTSFLSDQGTGNLKILAQNFIVSNPANTETMIAAVPDGAAELYYDSAKKLATASFGAQVTGSLAVDTITNASASTDVTIDTNFDIILDAGGGVGVGVSSPSAKAHIRTASSSSPVSPAGDELFVEGSGDAGITIGAGNTSKASLFFADNGDSAAGRIRYEHSDNSMQFGTNGQAERLRVDASGNLLVGTTDTSPWNNTSGTGILASSGGVLAATSSGDAAFYGNRLSSDGDIIQFRKDGSTVGSIGVTGSNNPYFSSGVANHGGLIFSDGGASTPQMNPLSSGSTLADGVMNIGSTSYRFKDLYLSNSAQLANITNGAGEKLILNSDNMVFQVQASEAMRIDASGNVGISRTNPSYKLHISTTATNGTAVTGLSINNNASNSGVGAKINLGAGSGFDSTSGGISGFFDGTGTALAFLTSGNYGVSNHTERMRIDSSGRLLINRTSASGVNPHSKLHVLADSAVSAATIQIGTNGYNGVSFLNASGSNVGSIVINASSTAYNTSSDHRLKETVVDMTGAIDRVKALAPKRFNFIADADRTVDGFLAHEAQAVVPEAVTGTHNEVDADGNAVMQGIDQSKLVPLLTGALREAITKIETLETQRVDLETRLTALENAE